MGNIKHWYTIHARYYQWGRMDSHITFVTWKQIGSTCGTVSTSGLPRALKTWSTWRRIWRSYLIQTSNTNWTTANRNLMHGTCPQLQNLPRPRASKGETGMWRRGSSSTGRSSPVERSWGGSDPRNSIPKTSREYGQIASWSRQLTHISCWMYWVLYCLHFA